MEATYPIDESIGTALIFLSGQVCYLFTLVKKDFIEVISQTFDFFQQRDPKDYKHFLYQKVFRGTVQDCTLSHLFVLSVFNK